MVDSLDLQRQLFAACEHGDLPSVQAILDQDASGCVDADGGEGYSPLQTAAGNGHEDIVRLLLMRGASLDRQNLYGWTALMQAASQGHTNIVALLLQNKADPNIRNKFGATALTTAAHYGHISIARLLLGLGFIDINENDVDVTGQAFTPLMAAAMNGQEIIVNLLIEKGANQFQVHRPTGWTLLMMASVRGFCHMTKTLVEGRGCDPDVTNILHRTALEIAILQNHGEVREYLDRRTTNRPKLLTDNSKPEIIEATESGDIKRVQHILDSKPKQCNKLSPEGATPLMIAAMIGRGDIAELLVQRGADINMQDAKSGWTALMQATFHRRKELVKFLVDAGADVNIKANDGCKALDLALVIVMNENDKANNELISLLAAVTMPTNGNKPGQGHMTKSSTWSIKTSMSQSSQDSPRNGLKAWWSRMSNRFRNLKLSRTLRAGLSTTPLTPFEDENQLSTPTATLKVSQDAIGKVAQEDDGRIRRKSSRDQGSELNRSRNSVGRDSGLDLSMQSSQSISIMSPASQQPSDKLLPVVPPFLPPPNFELHTYDRTRRTHHSSSKPSLMQLANGQGIGSTRPAGRPPTKLMFSHRSGGSSGISPSNSAHFSNTASPNSSAEANAMAKGFANARRTTLKIREAAGTSKLSSVVEPLFTPAANLQGIKPSKHQQVNDKPPAATKKARLPPLPVTPPNANPASASSASSTISGSLGQSKPRPVSGMSRSTSPTLTPSPSPTPKVMGVAAKEGSHHSQVKGVSHTGPTLQKKTSSSSGISEDDELSALLRKLSLEKYAPIFEEQEVDMEAFLSLNESDLKEMGIASTEPLQQILGAITELKDGKYIKKYSLPDATMVGYSMAK